MHLSVGSLTDGRDSSPRVARGCIERNGPLTPFAPSSVSLVRVLLESRDNPERAARDTRGGIGLSRAIFVLSSLMSVIGADKSR